MTVSEWAMKGWETIYADFINQYSVFSTTQLVSRDSRVPSKLLGGRFLPPYNGERVINEGVLDFDKVSHPMPTR